MQRTPQIHQRDLWTDETGRPLIGFPLGKRVRSFDNGFIRETFLMGRLVGWQGLNREHPVIEYPDGTMEVIQSLAMTNWGNP